MHLLPTAINDVNEELFIQAASKELVVHTDDDGEQKVAAVFHLEHNRVVRRRVAEPQHPRVVLHASQVLAVAHLDDETAVRHAPELNCKQASTDFLSTRQTSNGRAVYS
jgi:hypothetical protein